MFHVEYHRQPAAVLLQQFAAKAASAAYAAPGLVVL
jgi:hypothetical protein